MQQFIKIIRNAKTMAEERALYQREMASIRQAFSKNQQHEQNMMKLLFIHMSGVQTAFGQFECLKLITSAKLIQKRIGYLALTQLFDENSELLMMATNRIKIDLSHSNIHVVQMVLVVLSQICTPELAKELYPEVLKCIKNASKNVQKKAIMCSIRIVKKCPSVIQNFLPSILEALSDKNHGILLGTFSFLQTILDSSTVESLAKVMGKMSKIYKQILYEYSSQYQIGGVQDPFLQVAILKFIRSVKNMGGSKVDVGIYAEMVVMAHDSVCSRINSHDAKNGATAVLLQCLQCLILLPKSQQLENMIENILFRLMSSENTNEKYLSLHCLYLLSNFEINIVRKHKDQIIKSLNEEDLRIRRLSLDLLYLVTSDDNGEDIVDRLMKILMEEKDEEFVAELSDRICLIIEKSQHNKKWHFDTILKLMSIGDGKLKEDSHKVLINLVVETEQIQKYCLEEVYKATLSNKLNLSLAKVFLYLIGQFGEILNSQSQQLIQFIHSIIIFDHESIEYGLSALFKLYNKFSSQQELILDILKLYENHSKYEIQKRACEYGQVLKWGESQRKYIGGPIPLRRERKEQQNGDFDKINLLE